MANSSVGHGSLLWFATVGRRGVPTPRRSPRRRPSRLGVFLEPAAIEQADAARLDGDEPFASEAAEDLADGFPVGTEVLGQVLVAVAGDGAEAVGLAQQQ